MNPQRSITLLLVSACLAASLAGCSTMRRASNATPGPTDTATLAPRLSTYRDLTSLPKPRGKIVAAVYNFRDQTGQYKAAPASSFSTAVTQGATSMLQTALNDSGWFITLEREGLQNILTERKIIRAAQKKPDVPTNNSDELPSLLSANILLEGGVVGFDSNIETGGAGVRYFGIGTSEEYRVDQVTVNLRAIDIRTGRILHSVLTTKAIYSQEIRAGVFRFIEFKRLLEIEGGVTTNEPAQICVLGAIESAVIHLIAEGIEDKTWVLDNPSDINSSVLKSYLAEQAVIF